jgi:hypothetical protein
MSTIPGKCQLFQEKVSVSAFHRFTKIPSQLTGIKIAETPKR